jgi:CTP:molybdopterin cytidylyltransferase MocA
MKPTLLVLAAGMGTRYGGNKQLDEVGPSGETIIDYSIYDAIRAGFAGILRNRLRRGSSTGFRAKLMLIMFFRKLTTCRKV